MMIGPVIFDLEDEKLFLKDLGRAVSAAGDDYVPYVPGVKGDGAESAYGSECELYLRATIHLRDGSRMPVGTYKLSVKAAE